jgi:hypothetical protein
MKKNPKVTGFTITGQEKQAIPLNAGDTLSVVFEEIATYPDGRRMVISEKVVLSEKITEHMITDEFFIARANIDGQPAKMGGFTIKKEEK